jgi:hypothetical protein
VAKSRGTGSNAIRIDPWSGAAPLILTECRSLAGALRTLARDYAVKITATNGQVGGFLHTDVAPALGDRARVLYLGDFDLAGADIEANTRRAIAIAISIGSVWRSRGSRSPSTAWRSSPSQMGGSRMAERTTRSKRRRSLNC